MTFDPARAPEGAALLPPAESKRLAALRATGLLDGGADPPFDRVATLVARSVGAPMAFVSLVEPHRHVVKAGEGGPAPLAPGAEVPTSHSLCAHVVRTAAPLVLADARADAAFSDHPAVAELGVGSYLGVPLRAPTGEVLGAVCAVGTEPRPWSAGDEATLTELSAVLTETLVARATARRLDAERREHDATRALTDGYLDALGDVFLAADAGGRVVRWNRRACEVTGCGGAALSGRALADCFDAGDRDRLGRFVAEVAAGRPARTEASLVTADGVRVPYELSGTPVGVPEVVVCVVGRDVADRHEADRALRASEARFRSFVEATAEVVWLSHPDGSAALLSGGWSSFTGQAVGEGEAWGWVEAVHPDDVGGLLAGWERHLADGAPYAAAYRLRRHDGAYRWFEGLVVPVADAEGGVVEWIGTARDVEAQRAAERELAASEERLTLALEAARMGTWDHDLRTGTWTLSGRALALYGLPPESDPDVGAVLRLVVEDDRERFLSAVADTTAGGGHSAAEFRVRHPGGRVRWLRSEGRATPDEAGVPARVTGVVSDVTARKRRERELVRAREEAEEAARLKSALLANMSHEIRTPLTAVIGYAQVLRDEVGPGQADLVEPIERGGHRLLATLDAVLDLSQIESGQRRVTLGPVDAAAVAAHVAERFRSEATERGLSLALDAGRPAPALADPAALDRVLTHLVSNAVKFTERGGVTVRVAAGDREVCVDVADTGVGMDPAFVPHAFDAFRQESTGEDRRFEGAGLGLSVVRELARLLGARVGVETARGEGTTVRVALRVALRPAPPGT